MDMWVWGKGEEERRSRACEGNGENESLCKGDGRAPKYQAYGLKKERIRKRKSLEDYNYRPRVGLGLGLGGWVLHRWWDDGGGAGGDDANDDVSTLCSSEQWWWSKCWVLSVSSFDTSRHFQKFDQGDI